MPGACTPQSMQEIRGIKQAAERDTCKWRRQAAVGGNKADDCVQRVPKRGGSARDSLLPILWQDAHLRARCTSLSAPTTCVCALL
jgi:hypothetical protein